VLGRSGVPPAEGKPVRCGFGGGLPAGRDDADVKHYETRRAIFDGAAEVGTIINIGALKSGDLRLVERDIEAVTAPCREAGV
jgi:deoxyribose-phosphate aldolase